jgi:hypothetical protein
MQRNDRSYKDLKQKQKSAIADKTYKMHLKFYLENQRMPDATEMNDICKSLFTAVQSLAPKTEYEEFYKIVEKREKSYEERILRDIQNGIIIETLMAKKHKKTPEEKAAVAKQRSSRGEQDGNKKQEIIWLKKKSCKMTDFSLLPVIPPEVHRMVSPGRKWV